MLLVGGQSLRRALQVNPGVLPARGGRPLPPHAVLRKNKDGVFRYACECPCHGGTLRHLRRCSCPCPDCGEPLDDREDHKCVQAQGSKSEP